MTDADLNSEAYDAKRRSWLKKHDQHTAHIPSMYALAVGMPIRLTDTVDKERRLFKGTPGKIFGWTQDPEADVEEVDGEYVANRLPLVVYVHFAEATWKIGSLPQGVYPMKRIFRTWYLRGQTGAVRRGGGVMLLAW